MIFFLVSGKKFPHSWKIPQFSFEHDSALDCPVDAAGDPIIHPKADIYVACATVPGISIKQSIIRINFQYFLKNRICFLSNACLWLIVYKNIDHSIECHGSYIKY